VQSSAIEIHAAKFEFEAFQLVLAPGSGSVSIDLKPFASGSLGVKHRVDAVRCCFVCFVC
jgi:hypothetical protein